MSKPNFFQELKRRNVYKVAITYVVVAWLIMQVAAIVLPAVDAPDWVMRVLLFFLAIGLPIALVLAWAFEMSPEGIIPTTSVEAKENPYPDHKKKPLTSMVAIGVLLLVVIGQFGYNRYWSTNAADIVMIENAAMMVTDKSIAVLPFKNDSPDKDNEYFCNGMVEEILNYLQKISALEVKARTSIEQYRNPSRDIRSIAKELEVAFIIEGSVRKFGDDVRITAQLIEAKTGNHLWSETYDGKYTDQIFEFQSEIARKIAASLNVIIVPNEEERINKVPATDMVAYDLYIRANHERWAHIQTGQHRHAKAAHDLFDQALRIEPNYLLAIVGKGQTFNVQGKYDSAFIYADKAIAIDPEFNRSIGLKGYCYLYTGQIDLALEHFFRAIRLPPKDDFWFWYHVAIGQAYSKTGNEVKALPYFKKGLGVGSQYLSSAYTNLARCYFDLGDYESADQYLGESLELEVACWTFGMYSWLLTVEGNYQEALQFADSNCPQVECKGLCYSQLFRVSYLLGEYEKAEQYFLQWQNAGQIGPSFQRHTMNYEIGYVYSQLRKTEEANKAFTEEIKKLESQMDGDKRDTHLHLSRIYAFQGNKKQALKSLAEFAKLGFKQGWHDFIQIDPFFESLRDDPEFKAIVKQAQEEKAALRAQVREMERRGELDL